jgi:hypothetical protein
MSMVRMQDKTSSIPQAAYHSLVRRITFLIAEFKRKVGMVRKDL